MELSLQKIAQIVGGSLVGDGQLMIHGVAGIKEAQEGHITFLANPKYISFLKETKASAVLVASSIPAPSEKAVILCESPSLAFAKVVEYFFPAKSGFPKGIHPTAVIGKDVVLGKEVNLGPYVVIEDEAQLGDKVSIGAGSFIGHGVKIGSDALIYPNVTLREKVSIGTRVIIHSGTVIGSDGFGYETVKGIHYKIPQVGIVVIEDDVEIGSNVSIDRARFGKTVIGKGTKIDNLVQIAHNVEIGEHCLVVAQVGISGTTKVGHHVTLAGQVGLVGHIEVGDHAIVAAQAGVSNSIPGGAIYGGYPAVPLQEWKRSLAYIHRLEKWTNKIKELEKKIQELLKVK